MGSLLKQSMARAKSMKGGSLSSIYTGIDPATRKGTNQGQSKRGGAARRQPARQGQRGLGPARTPLSS
jgi:hypothetical protein